MGKQVIAEWVETPDALKILQGIGAENGQGYAFSPPVMLDEKRGACMAGSYVAASNSHLRTAPLPNLPKAVPRRFSYQ